MNSSKKEGTTNKISLSLDLNVKEGNNFCAVMDKTLTPSPWSTLMDYPNVLPKWTTLNWTTPKHTISDEYYIKKLRFYTFTAQIDLHIFVPRGLQPPF